MRDYDKKLAEFKALISKTEYLKYTLNSLIYWDKITYMPPAGIEYRTKVMSFLADEQYKFMSGSGFNRYVKYFSGNKKNDFLTDAFIRRICRNSDYVAKIPEEEYSSYIELIARSEQVWEAAKAENDFERFEPYLEQIFDTFRKFAEYWGPAADPYSVLMGYYEEGLDVAKTDSIVEQIKPILLKLLGHIREAHTGPGAPKPLAMPKISGERQKAVWEMVLSELGFDFQAGRVDIGPHPTVLANSPSDVRIVNSYSENDVMAGLFNAIHSCGKGLYQQAISPKLLGMSLAEAPSFAMEESIARLYENMIGRSAGFWKYFHDRVGKMVPEVSVYDWREIYEDVNLAEPGPIRIEAEQFTYLLHIIIRYEIEREAINGRLAVKDFRKVWNDKYEEYLGMRPQNDSEGILQDIHWAGGYVGYFPSYFVSNLTAAQIGTAIGRDCGALDELTERGEFGTIRDWLERNVFRYGAVFDSSELTERATGKPLGAEDYISYLRKRFSEVYKIIL